MSQNIIPVISIVLPCYNSAATVLSTLIDISKFIRNLDKTFEIIISDDGSTDGIDKMDWNEYSSQFNARYLRSSNNGGKGEALRKGLYQCKGSFIFFMDIDIPIELDALARALNSLESGESHVVIGNRRMEHSSAVGTASVARFFASKVFNSGVQIIALPGYQDTQCPMKGFTAEVINVILPLSFLKSFSFDVELIYLSKIYGYKIKQIYVNWKDARAFIPPVKLSLIIINCLIDVAYLRLKHRII